MRQLVSDLQKRTGVNLQVSFAKVEFFRVRRAKDGFLTQRFGGLGQYRDSQCVRCPRICRGNGLKQLLVAQRRSAHYRSRAVRGDEQAVKIVVRFLRERVTIAEGSDLPAAVAEIWQRQITNERGFEAVYVAALRSVGIPARMGERKQAELFADGKWQATPRPLVERWQ